MKPSYSSSTVDSEVKEKTFYLRNLPLIIQQRIIERMKMKSVFNLSLTSKTMCAHIHVLRATTARCVSIRFQEENTLRISFDLKHNDFLLWSVKIPKNPLKTSIYYRLKDMLKLDEHDVRIPIQKYRETRSRWAGKEDLVLRGWKSTHFRLEFQSLSNNWNSSVDFFNRIFPGHCDQLEIEGEYLTKNFVPPPIPVTKELSVDGDKIQWSALKRLLKKVNVLENLSIFGFVEGKVKDLRLFKADVVDLQLSPWFKLEQIVTSNCRVFKAHVLMYSDLITNVEIQDIVNFIEAWKKCTNLTLEYLEVKWKEEPDQLPVRFSEDALRKLDAKQWDPRIRDEDFSIEMRDKNKSIKYVIPCGSGFDVRRSDGLIATCRLTQEQFQFVVWYKRFADSVSS